jgi:putative transcriptional regulator
MTIKNDTIRIYNRIKLYRIAADLSRDELSKFIGVNFQTIGFLEREDYNPSLELALKISQFFKVRVEDIFSFTPFLPINHSQQDPINQSHNTNLLS